MAVTASKQRLQISSSYAVLAYPEQLIVETVETDQHSRDRVTSNLVDVAPQQNVATTQPEFMGFAEDEDWSNTATIIRRDSFSRTRTDEDEDVLMDEDAEDDADSIVTQIRVEEDFEAT